MGDDDDREWQTVKRRQNIRRGNHHPNFDIATAKRNNNREYNNNYYTTFFFTNFPESFGAKAMFNVFEHYGDIMEVVIPIKRDKGGRRFGFARFDKVPDTRRFESELDNIIIGRDKIAVNLSRFHRSEGFERSGVRSGDRMGEGDNRRSDAMKVGVNNTRYLSRQGQNYNIHPHVKIDGTFAQAVRGEGKPGQERECKRVVLSYEAEKEDMSRLQKSFIGEVEHPGMSYNIQNAFHSQGYFGVKVTPLGSNLTLLEGQEEGEVQALMEEAKGWLDQWFKDIRPWTPKDIDLDRNVWLRIYGIPAHAWNDLFFARVTKPWGSFINADDVTMKKISMDVARLLIRTSCQRVVDEFFDVKVNGEIFHLRVIEDSYGPMRIMLPNSKGTNGRDNEKVFSEEEEEDEAEEEERGRWVVEEEPERESVGEEANLLALTPYVNTSNNSNYVSETVLAANNDLEDMEENSNLNFTGGMVNKDGVADEVDGMKDLDGNLLGLEVGEVGPANSSNIHHTVMRGVTSRLVQSEDLGRVGEPINLIDRARGGKGEQKGGVYSDGP
ncbi:hypothetical protein A2U01_0006695, partial [Trifolium medium]|nr:hypothetical protein [Trifolium medium]